MSQSGEHTWDLHLEYQKCSQCGKIFEDRRDYDLSNGQYEKTIECPFCKKQLSFSKPKKASRFFPLFGKEQPPEMLWP